MNRADSGPSFKELIPSLRVDYAFLKCGSYILQEVFLWLQNIQDIPNVEEFLLQDLGMSNADYRRHFNRTTREIFHNNGIRKTDITALWKLFRIVMQFFNEAVQPWPEVEELLNKIKNDRNEIIHTLLLTVKIHNQAQLEDCLTGISNLVENIVSAFDRQYGVNDQQRACVRDFVNITLNQAKERITEDTGMPQVMDIDGNDTGMDDDTEHVTVEDTAINLIQQLFIVAGPTANLIIQHHGTGDINFTHNVFNIRGGENTFNL